MKVIFLDHDGVICLQNNWGNRHKKEIKWVKDNPDKDLKEENPVEIRFDNFDEKAVSVLNQILEKSGAEIVVSSDWKRWASVDELGEYYSNHGIIKKPIDATKLSKDMAYPTHEEFKFWDRNQSLEQERHFEILEWLERHPEVTHWVAVDDLNMAIHIDTYHGPDEREWGLSNFVWTPRMDEGIKQSGIKKKILDFLKD